MARDSQTAAIVLERDELSRSSASRFYYAAFQICTAVLLYRGLTPPEGEEGWSHAATPNMLKQQLEPVIKLQDNRQKIASFLGELYKVRLEADYIGDVRVDAAKLKVSARKARYLVKTMEEILP